MLVTVCGSNVEISEKKVESEYMNLFYIKQFATNLIIEEFIHIKLYVKESKPFRFLLTVTYIIQIITIILFVFVNREGRGKLRNCYQPTVADCLKLIFNYTLRLILTLSIGLELLLW